MLRQCLLFPDAPPLIATHARRPMQFRLLLELENGFISYLLIHQRSIPDVAHIAAIAPTLDAAIQGGTAPTHVADLIQEWHGLAVDILDIPFIAANTWNVETVVNASLASEAMHRTAAGLSALRQQLLEDTEGDLRGRIESFLRNLDPDILAVHDWEDLLPSRYNYLAGGTPTLRRNRLQAASLYPWLMRHVLWNGHLGALAERVRRAIDAGAPLIEVFAQGLAVSPSTVRTLTRCPLHVLNTTWHGNIQRLARALNGITPEFRPRSEDDWLRMGAAVTTIWQVSGHAIARPQNQLWLAAAARRRFDVRLPDMEDTAALTVGLADMRNALRDILALRLGNRQSWPLEWLSRNPRAAAVIDGVIGRALMHVDFSRLLEIVRRWQDAFRRHQSANGEDSALIRGLTWRAPLDGFRTEDRTIVPLLTQAELIEEGNAMHHCVGSYSCDCRMGRVQIWSIRAPDGHRCSTLATRFQRRAAGGWKASISQHSARANAQPDASSIAAARALIANLSANHEDLKGFWEWRQTLAPLSPKDRGMLIVTRALERSLAEVLPRKLSLDSLAAEVARALGKPPIAR
jgi:hypothetical protein